MDPTEGRSTFQATVSLFFDQTGDQITSTKQAFQTFGLPFISYWTFVESLRPGVEAILRSRAGFVAF